MVIYGCVWVRLVPRMGTKRVDSPSLARLADVSSLEDQWDGADILVALAQKETFEIVFWFWPKHGQKSPWRLRTCSSGILDMYNYCFLFYQTITFAIAMTPKKALHRCSNQDWWFDQIFSFIKKTISLVFEHGSSLTGCPEPESHFR